MSTAGALVEMTAECGSTTAHGGPPGSSQLYPVTTLASGTARLGIREYAAGLSGQADG